MTHGVGGRGQHHMVLASLSQCVVMALALHVTEPKDVTCSIDQRM